MTQSVEDRYFYNCFITLEIRFIDLIRILDLTRKVQIRYL